MGQGKLLDRAKLENAYTTYLTIFDMSMEATPVIYPSISTVLTGVGPRVELKWLGDVPVMKLWEGTREVSKLRAESHSLITRWYANGIEVDVDDINDDRFGQVRPRIEEMAEMGPRKIDAITVDHYVNGFAGTIGLTFDGQYLFDSDHKSSANGTDAQSNLVSGALSDTTWNSAVTKMLSFTASNGEPIQVHPDLLLVGPQNQLVARKLLQQQTKATGEQNIDAGTAQLAINARITGTHWFAIARNRRIKPVIVGVDVPPSFTELMGADDLHVFLERTILAGAHMKVGFAYGDWRSAVGSTG